MKRIREDLQEEKQNAHESGAVIHSRLDDQAKPIAHLDTTVAISGGVDAQIREEIKTLKNTVDRNQASVQPAPEEWKRMKTLPVEDLRTDRIRRPDDRRHCRLNR